VVFSFPDYCIVTTIFYLLYSIKKVMVRQLGGSQLVYDGCCLPGLLDM